MWGCRTLSCPHLEICFISHSCYKLFFQSSVWEAKRGRGSVGYWSPDSQAQSLKSHLTVFFLKTHPLVCSVFTAVIIRAIMIRTSPSLRSLPTRDGEWQLLKHLDICLNVCCLANHGSTCSPSYGFLDILLNCFSDSLKCETWRGEIKA